MESPTLLSGWESFYVIVGSSAAGLTGLQFVVMTLISETQTATPRVVSAFSTPTVVHFGAIVLVAAVLSAPWSGLVGPAAVVGAAGAAGVLYAAMTVARMRGQGVYAPVLEDWIWHAWLPLAAYATLLGAAATLPRLGPPALFAIAAAALLLLFIGIHNAWDTVTYLTIDQRRKQAADVAEPPPSA